MKDSSEILNRLEQRIVQSQNSSSTAVGHHSTSISRERKEALIDAINQAFQLLRINYHHLYFSAYKEIDALDAAKRLWLESLSSYSAEIIVAATHKVIKQSDYLPTVSQLIKQCQQLTSSLIIPDVHGAYVEACKATSPKQNYPWVHPIVYYAGRNSDWFFLANNPESIAFPVFKRHYQQLCQRLYNGESLPPVKKLALPETVETPLNKAENAKRMAALKRELGTVSSAVPT
jgi:Replication protein P